MAMQDTYTPPRDDFTKDEAPGFPDPRLADCKDQMSAAQLVAHHRAGELEITDQQTCRPIDPHCRWKKGGRNDPT